jgi:hypothetical protein
MAEHWHRQSFVSIKMKLLFKFNFQYAEIKDKARINSCIPKQRTPKASFMGQMAGGRRICLRAVAQKSAAGASVKRPPQCAEGIWFGAMRP